MAFALAAAPAQAALHVDVRAAEVTYFPDLALVAGSGHAVVAVGKRTIAADAVRYDLEHDRLLASGHVRVTEPGGIHSGAAYTLEPLTGVQHLLATDPLPVSLAIDRTTGAEREAPAPAGTFDAADLSGSRPYLRGKRAQILGQVSVRMTPAVFPNPIGPNGYLPTFLYTFSPNANLYTTALPTVTFDQPFSLATSTNALTQFHLRYDTNLGAGAGIEEHLVDGNRAYLAVAGIEGRTPAADLTAYDQIGRQATANVTASSSQGYNAIQTKLTYAIPNTLNAALTGTQATGYGAQSISASTIDFSAVRKLLGYKFTAGYSHVLGIAPAQTPFESQWFTTLGGSVYTNGLSGPLKSSLQIRFDYQFSGFDFPHNTLAETTSISLSRALPHNLSFFGAVVFAQTDDRYRYNAAQNLQLSSPQNPYVTPNGTIYPGYLAYQGLATQRTYSAAFTYSPNSSFNASVGFVHSHDFPDQFEGYGRPPLAANISLRVRITPTVSLQYTRSYDFGWNGQYFAPGASLTITP